MAEKGLLTRDESQYETCVQRRRRRKQDKEILLERFVNTMYNGSASNLMMQLLGNKKTSKKEIETIKELIKNWINKLIINPVYARDHQSPHLDIHPLSVARCAGCTGIRHYHRSTRNATARLRYNLLGIVMILFFAGSVITFITQWHVEESPLRFLLSLF